MTYRVQRMTRGSYDEYMTGGYNYSVENLDIEANSPEEAIEKAKKEGYVVNDYVESYEEIEAKRQARIVEWEAEQLKKQKAEAKRIANEKKRAEEAGLTVEEFRAEKKRIQKVKNVKREIENRKKYIEDLKNQIRELEGELAEREEYLAKLED